MKLHLNDGWSFALGEPRDFTPVSLPHDYLIGDPQHWYRSAVGWYQRTLDTPYLGAGRRVLLRFDGVYMNSTLYVNGAKAGEWKNGFTAFEHDITDFLVSGEANTLLMKVDARFPSSRWYTGAGIYREVSLIIRNACHFASDGIHITTTFSDGQWEYKVDAETETDGRACEIKHVLLEGGDIIPWSPDKPQMYTLRSTLSCEGQVMDTVDTRFGFRQLGFNPETGFSINGQHMKLNGACLHQEFSIVGAAVNRDFIIRQFRALRRMGVNAVRTAHNPPSKVFMELADSMGMLVFSEFADVWQLPKTEHDYARAFDAWHERDVASWIRRDRNSPSVILWSLGNEIPDTHADLEKGRALLERLKSLVKHHDAGGQARVTLGSNYMAWENTQQAARSLEAVGYNYSEYLYQAHHAAFPDWVIYGSETCSTVQSRGVYHFPLSQPTLSDDDLQTSSLGNSTTSWGARSVDDCIKDDRNTPFSLGHFIWTGQDYLGEPTPYHTKNSYFGMLDTAGIEKDAFYLFQAAWTDEPMVHLFPYWDHSPGQTIDVRAASNQHRVALFLNDRALGSQAMDGEVTRNWRVAYEPGILRAEAYDESGRVTATTSQASFGEAAALRLEEERLDTLSFYTITALDAKGLVVHNARNRVRVRVSGGSLLGLDNGDSSDYTPYQADERRLFSGKMAAVVQRIKGQEPQVYAEFVADDIPVRKITLHREGMKVSATLLPPDANPQVPQWRLTNAAGIDSRNASFTVAPDGLSITIQPLSDGEVTVRCGVFNGKAHLDFYSVITLVLDGHGQQALNPYEEVSAGLYTYSNVALTNGNERGVATLRGQESWVCFEPLDFGQEGARELSLWLFPLANDPFDVDVYQGRPDQGGKRLARARYDLGMVWNVYQELRITLPEALRGVQHLCFVFQTKTHVRGFQFYRSTRGFEAVDAASCDEVYGDSFEKDPPLIRGIGNNTSLLFTGFDFGEAGTDRVLLRYTSANEQNPVLVQFDGANGAVRSMLSLPATQGMNGQVFQLGSRVTGRNTVRLVFLPGSSLDLASLRFLASDSQEV